MKNERLNNNQIITTNGSNLTVTESKLLRERRNFGSINNVNEERGHKQINIPKSFSTTAFIDGLERVKSPSSVTNSASTSPSSLHFPFRQANNMTIIENVGYGLTGE
jgi:hypothetical protein